jgi:hypothetical protein
MTGSGFPQGKIIPVILMKIRVQDYVSRLKAFWQSNNRLPF